ncbi:MAG TPA: GNAT family N-acetyltransferase [Candidatus Limnocylindria bacterium]|nr:GNAT family N-acetyltransferase [Candidatus Limnocylindria bacterium]
MPCLAPPSGELHASYLEALDEFRAEGRLGPGDSTGLAHEAREGISGLDDPEGFAAYVAGLRGRALPETPRPSGWVPETILWFSDGPTFIGRLSIRHRLTDSLRETGGHIGYDVRPSARRRGHGTEMLRQARPIARQLGIDPALVTCDVDNIGSRKVIEANGGRLEDVRHGKRRYWVPTGRTGDDRAI